MLEILHIQKEIDELLQTQSINKFYNLYLIGSRTSNKYSKDSDFDLILYFNENKNVSNLTLISQLLNSNIKSKYKITVKVFDKETFRNLFFQDYFRYLEYKLSYQPIKETNNIFINNYGVHSDTDLLKNLLNSIIIQYWWSIITISNSIKTKTKIENKLISRIYRNIELYIIETKRNIEFLEVIKKLSEEFLFKEIRLLNKENYLFFLKDYFNTFEHEKINKSYLYKKTLQNNFEVVKSTINKIKIL